MHCAWSLGLFQRLWGERVEPPPVRWALIYTHQFAMPAIRLITEDRIQVWEDHGWKVLVTDTTTHDQAIEDVRLDDEKGKR